MTSLILIALAIILILNSLIQIYFKRNIKGSSKILKRGLYSLIRHPQYLGYLIISIEIFLWSDIELKTAFIFLIVLLISHLLNYEEFVLTKKYGDEFVEYKSVTKKLIPYIY
jgi:protein-S-isoprenylcysteine O-methyltransferase Ste14